MQCFSKLLCGTVGDVMMVKRMMVKHWDDPPRHAQMVGTIRYCELMIDMNKKEFIAEYARSRKTGYFDVEFVDSCRAELILHRDELCIAVERLMEWNLTQLDEL